jgi:hypothetical protein
MPIAARRYGSCLLACFVLGARSAPPVRLVIHEKASLAWWQINPHLGDLWGTTCPAESSWHAGREEDPFKHRTTGYAAVMDTIIPLYPRPTAQAVCAPGVSGEVSVSDTVTWHDVRGQFSVDVYTLTSGMPGRDTYARGNILDAGRYPTIDFQLDSVTGVARKGDTLTGMAYGVFRLRGMPQAVALPVRAWREPLGLRVTAKTGFPAMELITTYGMSKMSLGLGVASKVWKEVHWGIDAVLVPPGAEEAN